MEGSLTSARIECLFETLCAKGHVALASETREGRLSLPDAERNGIGTYGDVAWLHSRAVPFWRAMAARVTAVDLPFASSWFLPYAWGDDYEHVDAQVELLHPWTRLSMWRAHGCQLPWEPGTTALEAWQASRDAGPPADPALADQQAVDASYRTLIETGEASTPPLLERRGSWSSKRAEDKWGWAAAPWLVAMVLRAEADGRHLRADFKHDEHSTATRNGKARIIVELIDPATGLWINDGASKVIAGAQRE